MLTIGFSSCFLHADPKRAIFKGKTLLYMEQSLAHWVMEEGALVYLIPSGHPNGRVTLEHLISRMDGVVLQGGADVSPKNYGEEPLKPEWAGDWVRDQHEIAIVNECLKQKKPLLGICRGAQLLNVALGGSLYQDIQTQVPSSRVHRDWDKYDNHFHHVHFVPGTPLARLYPGQETATVNTVHHQAIKGVAKTLRVEASCPEDGIVEAVRYTGDGYAVGLQWHPEFQDPNDKNLLDGRPVLREFLEAARAARGEK